jgi:hypothetical protein
MVISNPLLKARTGQGPGYGACRNAACVARALPLSRRRDNLSFSHHREVAALPVIAKLERVDTTFHVGMPLQALRKAAAASSRLQVD